MILVPALSENISVIQNYFTSDSGGTKNQIVYTIP